MLAGIFMVCWGISFYVSTKVLMWENQEIVMPKVIGFPLYEAERLMLQRKIKIKVQGYEETSDVPSNTVVAQSVEPGTIVKEDRTIMVHVSKQIESVAIPNFVGRKLIDAKKIIEKENLRLINIAMTCSKGNEEGKVVAQSPSVEEATKNQNIQLLVSSGPCLNQFVVGQMHDERVDATVKKDFSDKGIELKQTLVGNREDLKKAKVVTQEPPAGSIVKFGQSVVLSMD